MWMLRMRKQIVSISETDDELVRAVQSYNLLNFVAKMHSIAEIGTNVPAFLGKLWKMVEDPVTNDLIAWSSTGTSFVIKDEIRFARELLPMYYKHNNMASFIRQLNMYGFHKIVSPDAGSMKLETPDEIKFTHPFFMRGHPYLLDNIKRKIGVSKVLPGQLGEKTPQVINKVLSDVRQMKGRQETLDSRLTAMKLENGALWRELSVLRQKHLKQQQIVNKLIQFLVTIVHQNHNNFSVKRKYHRMLQHHHKSGQHEVTHPDDEELHLNNLSENSNSPTGPVIHELDPAEALLDTVVEEAVADSSTSNVANYFLNATGDENIEELAVNPEMPDAANVYQTLEDVEAETIIGMPEDTLINTNFNGSGHRKNTSSDTRPSTQTFQPKRIKKDSEILRPKYIKLVTKRKKNGETHKPKQVILVDPQKQMEQTLQQQLQINQNQLEINKQQLIKTEQQRVQCQQQVRQKTQQPKNGHSVKQKPQQLVQNRLQTNSERLPKTQPQQGILLQRLQQQPTQQQSPPAVPVITIPLDSGSAETIIPEMNGADLEPLLIDGTTADFSLPVVVEVPPMPVSPAQPAAVSPDALSPQDLLLTNDPVMTPRVDPSPVVTSPQQSPQTSADMQVACVDDSSPPASTLAMSPNVVTRSAPHHHNLFKIDPTDYRRSEMDSHIDSVQNDLDNLKELLRSEGISLDANTLLGYFNDDPLNYNMPDPMSGEEPKESSGNELMACNPTMFDFADLMGSDWSLPASPGDDLTAAGTTDDSFAEVNTPQFIPQSPQFPAPPNKKRKK